MAKKQTRRAAGGVLPEFKVPAAADAEEAGAAGSDAGMGGEVPEQSPPAADGENTDAAGGEVLADAAWQIELGGEMARTGRRVDMTLSVPAARGLARIREALRRTDERLANGRLPDPNSSPAFLRLLLERAADPQVKRIVFLTE